MREEPPITFRREALPIILSTEIGGWCEKGGMPKHIVIIQGHPRPSRCAQGAEKGNLITPLCLENKERDHLWVRTSAQAAGQGSPSKEPGKRKFGVTVNVSVEL
jgi:hypothetical protein